MHQGGDLALGIDPQVLGPQVIEVGPDQFALDEVDALFQQRQEHPARIGAQGLEEIELDRHPAPPASSVGFVSLPSNA